MDELTGLHEHGVFLRRDALGFGYDDRWLANGVRDGWLVRVRHGAYVDSRSWRAADAPGKHVLMSHAVTLSHRSEIAVSHTSGAAMHGMRMWRPDLERVHVVSLHDDRGRRHKDVTYHQGLSSVPAQRVLGSRVLTPAACALGAASLTSVESGVVVLDSAYNLGLCSEQEVKAEYDRMRGWPGTARLQVTLRLAGPGAQSVGESRARFLFWTQKVPNPLLQYAVWDGGTLVGTTDFAWPTYGLLGEFDGRVKYGALLKPGQDPSEVVYREKLREDRLREVTGWKMIRLTWSDLDNPRRTGERTRQALGIR